MITISKIKQGRGGWQYVFVSLTADGDICRTVVTTPDLTGTALQTYCDDREADYQVGTLSAMYPDARYQDAEGETELDKFENWISAGHTNAAYTDEEGHQIPEEVIEKVPWVDNWDVIKVTAENDMKDSVFFKKTDAQINSYIDTE